MKIFTFLPFALFFSIVAFGQCPTDGNIQLLSQSEIENFADLYPNCTDLQSNIQIAGPTVVDLSPLAGLTTISGYLQIGSPVLETGLVNLNGLNDLVAVGDLVIITNNEHLISFSGLESLETIGGYFHIGHGGSGGEGNILLENLLPLSNLVSIGGELEIFDNNSLTDLSGLESLISIPGALEIYSNDSLNNIDALDNVSIDGSYKIVNNASLQSLNIVDVSSGSIQIVNCPLQSLTGLTISGPITSLSINNISNLSSLEDVTISYPLELELLIISSLQNIANLNGLENIYSAGSLQINNNNSLEDINVFSNWNLDDFGVVTMQGNSNLSQCSIANFCQFLEGYGSDPFGNNAAGCNTKEEVLNVCAGCPYIENVQLLSQEDVDAFMNYPSCTEIGDLLINGDDIVNLSPLQNLVTANITITNNPLLTTLDGLQNLENSTSIIIKNNSLLTSLDGLQSIDVTGNVIIEDNPELVDVSALESITSVSNVFIKNNNLLTEIAGWNSLIGANNLEIMDNPSLVSIIGLQNLDVIELVKIKNNISLPNLNGLQGLTNPIDLKIEENTSLTNLSGLSYIQSLDTIWIMNNDSLTNLDGLEGVENIISWINIQHNPTLENLDGLSGVTNLGLPPYLSLKIRYNDNLTDISGVEFIDPGSIGIINIASNENLSECSVLSICLALQDFVNSTICCNATGCNSYNEIVSDCDITLNTVSGNILFDFDNNNICDTNDYPASSLMITATNTSSQTSSTLTNSLGEYELKVPAGEYTVQIEPESYNGNNFTSDPESVVVNFPAQGDTEFVDFCMQVISVFNDVKITQLALNQARPGFDSYYQLIFENIGTTVISGEVTFIFDDTRQTFLNSIPVEDNVSGNTITWSYSDLLPFESRAIELTFNTLPPPTNGIGDILLFEATVNPISGDENPLNNVFNMEQNIVNSQDPNDKRVMQGEEIYEDEVGGYLDYIIRFQNMGTADAIIVRIDDLLNNNLDWNTFRTLSSSHNYRIEIVNGNEVSFIYEDINLPPESSDPEGSQGYIAFQVKTKSDLEIGDAVFNSAKIYFDFNDPITTNTALTVVVDYLENSDINLSVKVSLIPNPVSEVLTISVSENVVINNVTVYSILGLKLIETSTNHLDFSNFQQGIYFVTIETTQGSVTKKVIKK